MLTIICLILLIILGVPYAIIITLYPFYLKWGIGKRLFHNLMGWHLPENEKNELLGINIKSKCRFCGREIIQDSQGNWFSC